MQTADTAHRFGMTIRDKGYTTMRKSNAGNHLPAGFTILYRTRTLVRNSTGLLPEDCPRRAKIAGAPPVCWAAGKPDSEIPQLLMREISTPLCHNHTEVHSQGDWKRCSEREGDVVMKHKVDVAYV